MNYTARGIVDKEIAHLDLIMRVTVLTQTSLGGQLINHNYCKGGVHVQAPSATPPPPPPPPHPIVLLAMSMECTQYSTGFINYDLVTNMNDCLHAVQACMYRLDHKHEAIYSCAHTACILYVCMYVCMYVCSVRTYVYTCTI